MPTTQNPAVETSLAAVAPDIRDKNAKVLQPILIDLLAYGMVVKQLHWSVVGPGFRPVHLQLDEIFAFTQEAIDSVAERMSATGHSPNGQSDAVAKATEIASVPSGFTRDREVVELAGHRTHSLIGLIRDRMATIEDVDTVTADLLHQICAGLEKHHWMLRAQLA